VATGVVPDRIAGVPTRAPSVGAARNYHLDAMRGISALIVVFDHMRGSFFVPYTQAGSGRLVRFIYIDHYVARAAVIFFFALSGYLVGTSVLKSSGAGRWSWSNYLLNRLTRLWMVLVPALLLALAIDGIGHSVPRLAPLFAEVAALDTPRAFFGTLFFVQNIYSDVFGSLGSAWSLAYEFWYYILFPIAVLAFVNKGMRRWLYGLLFVAVVVFSGKSIFLLFPVWLAGVVAGTVAARVPLHSALIRRGLFLVSFGVVVGAILLTAAHRASELTGDYIMGLGAMGLIWCALSSAPAGGTYAKAAIFLSEISYTLYLTHQPMLLLFSAAWLGTHRWPPDALHLLLTVVPIGTAVLFACLMYFLFESRTDALRKYLKKVLLDRAPTGA
jgi:peptidoglycan/LPS O-acetylase OafA/YrhL